MNINLELPINGLSFGQVSFGVLKEFFDRKVLPNIFPIGQVDLKAFDIDKPFFDWLQFCCQKAHLNFSRKFPTIRLWHLIESERRLSDTTILWTFHETDTLTGVEKNIIRNNDKVLFSSNYSYDMAKREGLENVGVCHPYFDSVHVKEDSTVPRVDAVNFLLIGKFEKRKHTEKIIRIWDKLFRNDSRFRLNCLIDNPFIEKSSWDQIVRNIFQESEGNIPWNINFIPRQDKNSQVNKIMNACDIDLSGLSGAEGFNLPLFNMLSLNKVCVAMDAHAHSDFLSHGKSFIVKPSKKIPIYDGAFFNQGSIVNQGNMFDFDDKEVEDKILEAVEFLKSGEKIKSDLPNIFSVKNTVDSLLSNI
jgi:glycosyltransferase involved in cell wall biosynthesis